MKKILNKNKFILLFALFFAFSGQLHAKKHNTISFQANAYYCTHADFNSNYHFFLAILGVNYQYHLSHGFSLFANYSFTTNQSYFNIGLQRYAFTIPAGNAKWWRARHDIGGYYYNPQGHLNHRFGYHFFDLGGAYHYALNKHMKVSGQLGLSYAYGLNEYVIILSWAPKWPGGMGDLASNKFVGRWEGYWGAVAGLSYDYYFWQGRINAGATVDFRYYEKSMPFFVNYGLHVGYNF